MAVMAADVGAFEEQRNDYWIILSQGVIPFNDKKSNLSRFSIPLSDHSIDPVASDLSQAPSA